MKHTRVIAAALVLAGGLGVAGNAGAQDHGGWKYVHHHATATGTFTDVGTVCDTAGQCVVLADAADVVFGADDHGTGVQGTSRVISPTGEFVLTATSTFVGSIRGCGSGTIVLTLVGTADLNATTVMHYTADLVPATGTGDFAGISGHFIGSTDLADPNSPATSDGIVRCHR